MAKVPQIINIHNFEITGSTAVEPSMVRVDLGPYGDESSGLAYFEVIAKNANASAQTIDLDRDDNVTHSSPALAVSLSITGSTSSYTRFRSSSFELSLSNIYYKFQPNSTDLTIRAARIVVLQDLTDLYSTQTQIEVGQKLTVVPANTLTWYAITQPKYFKYESAKWVSTPKFYLSVTAGCEDDMESYQIALQEDDGSFNWQATYKGTIGPFSTEIPTYYECSTPFTLTDGRHYRLVYYSDDKTDDLYLFNAKLIATQAGIDWAFKFYLGYDLGDAYKGCAQSFQSSGSEDLESVQFYLRKATGDSPTGNIYAKLYDHSGTYGSSSIPTGGALATSGAVDASTLDSSDYQWITFTFSSPYTMDASTYYCISIEYDSGVGGVSCFLGGTRGLGTHPGNSSYYQSGSWTADGTNYDLMFKLFGSTNSISEKFQTEHLLINYGQTGTVRQEYMSLYNPSEWDGYTLTTYHEHSASASGSDCDLQSDGGGSWADLSGGDVTGANLQRSSAVTMPSSAVQIDTQIVASS